MRKKIKPGVLSLLLGIAVLAVSVYFLLPSVFEVLWTRVSGRITSLEKSTLAENSKYRGTVESVWFEVQYTYYYRGTDYIGKDYLGGRSRYSVGSSPLVAEDIELLVDPIKPSQSMVSRPVSQLAFFGLFGSLILIFGPGIGWLTTRILRMRLEKSLLKSIEKQRNSKSGRNER